MTEELKNNTPLFLFDFDGVIVDTLDEATSTFAIFFKSLGLAPLSKEGVRDLYNVNKYESLKKLGVPENSFGDFLDLIIKRNEEGVADVRFYPGTEELLNSLSQYRKYIITSSSTEAVEKLLEKASLREDFVEVLGADKETSKVKKIDKVLSQENIDPNQAYFVTDTTGDIIEAKKSGVKTIAVGWGYHPAERLKKENPDYLFESSEELIKAIPGL